MNLFKKPLFKELVFLSATLIIFDRVAWHYHLYMPSIAGEFDAFMHFLGGLGVGVGGLWFYFYSGLFNPTDLRYGKFLLISFLSIIFLGFAWEVYEILIGFMDVNSSGYFYDTALDLCFDILGTVLACIYAFNKKLKTEWKINSQFTAELALQPEQI